MNYSLGNMLGGGFVGGLDPDAEGYIDAVVAAGGTVSGTQKNAINTFYKTGKSDGWYSSLKRMYLPIWGVAAPNAIDMIELGSGTFVGTVTQGAGFVQGDNSTGYFNTSTALHSVGLNGTQGMHGVLSLDDIGTDNVGCFVATNRMFLVNGATITSQMVLNTTTTAVLSVNFTGVIVASRTSATSHTLYRRSTASGFQASAENTTTELLNLPNVAPWFAGAANNNGTPLRGTVTGRQGAYFFGDGLTSAQVTDFSLALKNLWEGATGLTLP
jgi:hypothetical protein